MSLERLKLLAKVLETTQAGFNEVIEPHKEKIPPDADVGMEIASVTLFLSGLIVCGSLISSKSYLLRMRRIASQQNESTKEVATALFADAGQPKSADYDSDPDTLFLDNATVWSGSQSTKLGLLAIRLASVDGWFLGSIQRG